MSARVDASGSGYTFSYDYDRSRNTYYAIMRNNRSGWIKEIWYDRDGNTVRVDINGRTIRRIAEDGRSIAVTDSSGRVTRKFFDEWRRLIRVTYPDGSQVSHAYDPVFHLRTRTEDENGVVTTYAYDGHGNMIRKVEAVGTGQERETTREYDDSGYLVTVTRVGKDGEPDTVTRMAYDENGDMTRLTDPEGHVTTFTHDDLGNVLTRTDDNSHQWRYVYDDDS